MRVLMSLMLLTSWVLAGHASDPPESTRAQLRIDLSQMGYSPSSPIHHSDREVFRDMTLLMQDGSGRLSFVSENTLAVYFIRPQEKQSEGTPTTFPMEVFFVSTDSGKLIEHRTWNTLKRQWFNDSYDTEGRILEVRNGFLVNANAKLELYTPDLRLVKTYDLGLDSSPSFGMWSVAVAPGGDAIHIQPSEQTAQARRGSVSYFTGGGEAESTWLRSDSFEKIGTLVYFAGIHSVSHDSIVSKRAHCLDLDQAGKSTRHLTCSPAVASGLPIFLNDKEVLSVYHTGFSVLSRNGNEIWSAGGADPGIHRALMIESERRSMSGSRFAISLTGYKRKAVFDGVPVLHSPLDTIVAYDERCRQRIFTVNLTLPTLADFALSPKGRSLAVLTGNIISVYTLPGSSCDSKPW